MIRRAQNLVRMFGLNTLAIASFALLALSPVAWLGFVIGAAALAIAWYRNRTVGVGKAVAARILVTCGLLAAYVPELEDGNDYGLLVAAALLVMLIMHESMIKRVVSSAQFSIANLPGFATRKGAFADPQVVFHANTGMIVLLGAFAVPRLPSWPLMLVSIVLVLGVGALLLDARTLRNRSEQTWAELGKALEAYGPAFAVYFSGPLGVLYQFEMWLPYFERLGKPFVVVLRETHAYDAITGMTSAPVVVCNSIASLDNVAVEGLHAAFYVNNGMKNSQFVRLRHITHIQLLHGDSDKPPSYNPVTGMYDRIFVAGQAGIDRYRKHGIQIAESKFDIVGRPQVETIRVSEQRADDSDHKVVLYAPTWRGYSEDVNYCSLPVGKKLLGKLLERDTTIILRAHPFTSKDPASAGQLSALQQMLAADAQKTGRKHLFGAAATTEIGIVECFNRADVLVSDVSSVVSDFLFSEKPFAITDMVDEREGFTESFPLARAAYVLRRNMSNVDDVLDDLLKADPLGQVRREARSYYLGDFPTDAYADGFIRGARRYL